MIYNEVKIYTNAFGVEILTARLMNDLDITALSVEDPDEIANIENKTFGYEWDYIDEKAYPKDDEHKVIIYFDDSEESADMIAKVRELVEELKKGESFLGRLHVEVKSEDDSLWADRWKEYFRPAKVTEKIVIKPSWEEYEAADGELILEIDPGRAFGTGTHETTSGCLELMEKYMKEGDRVLDVGCGSGILSIGAALLGSSCVYAIDIDPVAVEVTKENVALNGFSDIVRTEEGDLTKGVDFKADIVAANLMADLVKVLTKDVAVHLEKDGVYISSGILLEKEDDVKQTLDECGFKVIDVIRKGEWCAIAAVLE
ncbi:MAG: 50S ribosomal protein L11 methyltransferase [Firmicutes bacterium]|nr:50S ribosomal protein L11 methyltransferase [Bacillota bacterium]